MKSRILLLLVSVFVFLPAVALSHSLSDSYLDLNVNENSMVEGSWLIAIEDVELAIGLDSNGDTQVTWQEILLKRDAIQAHLSSRLNIGMDGQHCTTRFGDLMLEQLSAGTFLYVPLHSHCATAGVLEVSYSLLFDIDASHRGILTTTIGDSSQVRLFSPAESRHVVDQADVTMVSNLWAFVVEGVWHIWIGLDHILFLCALLIPIVADKSRNHANGAAVKLMFTDILKVITAFTVAHSITLILATLELVVLPSRLVESVIALSVAVSGINIIWPLFRGHTWEFAFGFGLIHGFGFAGVLGDLSLPPQLFVSSLLSFNVGVEIGQLAIVLVLVPILLLLGRAAILRKLTIATTGIVITSFGVMWLLERSLNLSA